MSLRPTPEQFIIDFIERESHNPLGTPIYTTSTPQEIAMALLDQLDLLGYVVVHPDDIEELPEADYELYTNGWNNCRRRIFGSGS